ALMPSPALANLALRLETATHTVANKDRRDPEVLYESPAPQPSRHRSRRSHRPESLWPDGARLRSMFCLPLSFRWRQTRVSQTRHLVRRTVHRESGLASCE